MNTSDDAPVIGDRHSKFEDPDNDQDDENESVDTTSPEEDTHSTETESSNQDNTETQIEWSPNLVTFDEMGDWSPFTVYLNPDIKQNYKDYLNAKVEYKRIRLCEDRQFQAASMLVAMENYGDVIEYVNKESQSKITADGELVDEDNWESFTLNVPDGIRNQFINDYSSVILLHTNIPDFKKRMIYQATLRYVLDNPDKVDDALGRMGYEIEE